MSAFTHQILRCQSCRDLQVLTVAGGDLKECCEGHDDGSGRTFGYIRVTQAEPWRNLRWHTSSSVPEFEALPLPRVDESRGTGGLDHDARGSRTGEQGDAGSNPDSGREDHKGHEDKTHGSEPTR